MPNGNIPVCDEFYVYDSLDGRRAQAKIKSPSGKIVRWYAQGTDNEWYLSKGDVHLDRIYPYRHEALTNPLNKERTILLCEGPKDTDAAISLGFIATDGKILKDCSLHTEFFRDRDVVIVADKDPPKFAKTGGGYGKPTNLPPGDVNAIRLKKLLTTVARNIAIMKPLGDGIKDLAQWVQTHPGTEKHKREILEEQISMALSQQVRVAPTKNGVTLHDMCLLVAENFPTIRMNRMTGQIDDLPPTGVIQYEIEKLTGGKPPSREAVTSIVEVVCDWRSYDPLQEMISSLPTWDGHERLEYWLPRAASTPDAHASLVGRKWLISAIARALCPGVKVDYCLLLQGPQRTGKSTALSVIGGSMYRSMTGKELGARDTKSEIRAAWIAEFADLGQLPRAEIGVIKSFITDASDSFTAKYARNETIAPRRCVFAITDNPDGSGWLQDATGAFRFWPVSCPSMWDINWLKENRAQLLAESKHAFLENEQWWINPDELPTSLLEAQSGLAASDSWEDILQNHISREYYSENTPLRVYSLLKDTLNVPTGQINRSHEIRVSRILTSFGFKKHRFSGQHGRYWGYIKK